MRVTSDRQTLILAGESRPRRAVDLFVRGASAGDAGAAPSDEQKSRVTVISAHVEAIITEGIYASAGHPVVSSSSSSSLPELPPKLYQAYIVPNRGSSSYAANAYARTQDPLDRTSIVDTYA